MEDERLRYAELVQHAITVELEKGMDGMFGVGVDQDGNDKVVRTIIPGRCQIWCHCSFCLLKTVQTGCSPAATSELIKLGILLLSVNGNRSLGMLCEKLHSVLYCAGEGVFGLQALLMMSQTPLSTVSVSHLNSQLSSSRLVMPYLD